MSEMTRAFTKNKKKYFFEMNFFLIPSAPVRKSPVFKILGMKEDFYVKSQDKEVSDSRHILFQFDESHANLLSFTQPIWYLEI